MAEASGWTASDAVDAAKSFLPPSPRHDFIYRDDGLLCEDDDEMPLAWEPDSAVPFEAPADPPVVQPPPIKSPIGGPPPVEAAAVATAPPSATANAVQPPVAEEGESPIAASLGIAAALPAAPSPIAEARGSLIGWPERLEAVEGQGLSWNNFERPQGLAILMGGGPEAHEIVAEVLRKQEPQDSMSEGALLELRVDVAERDGNIEPPVSSLGKEWLGRLPTARPPLDNRPWLPLVGHQPLPIDLSSGLPIDLSTQFRIHGHGQSAQADMDARLEEAAEVQHGGFDDGSCASSDEMVADANMARPWPLIRRSGT